MIILLEGRRRAYTPLDWWNQPSTLPLPHPMIGHVRDYGMIHALYTYFLSQIGVSKREGMIKAPIIIEGAKHPRIEGGEVEKLNNLKFNTTVLEHESCSGYSGSPIKERPCHPASKVHTTHLVPLYRLYRCGQQFLCILDWNCRI